LPVLLDAKDAQESLFLLLFLLYAVLTPFGHMTVVSKPTHTSTGRLSQPECIKYQVHILTTVLLDSDVRGGMTIAIVS